MCSAEQCLMLASLLPVSGHQDTMGPLLGLDSVLSFCRVSTNCLTHRSPASQFIFPEHSTFLTYLGLSCSFLRRCSQFALVASQTGISKRSPSVEVVCLSLPPILLNVTKLLCMTRFCIESPLEIKQHADVARRVQITHTSQTRLAPSASFQHIDESHWLHIPTHVSKHFCSFEAADTYTLMSSDRTDRRFHLKTLEL